MELYLKRTDSKNDDFRNLVRQLDAELAERDGDEHGFYHQFNKIHMLKNCIIAYKNGIPTGCGAFKEYNEETVEIKRMYVSQQFRGEGIASKILVELENWAKECGYKNCILETGKKQPEAIALYQKMKYELIENFGPYQNVENSVCFIKKLLIN